MSKPVYAVVVTHNGDRKTTYEGWLNTADAVNAANEVFGIVYSIQPSIAPHPDGMLILIDQRTVAGIYPKDPTTPTGITEIAPTAMLQKLTRQEILKMMESIFGKAIEV